LEDAQLDNAPINGLGAKLYQEARHAGATRLPRACLDAKIAPAWSSMPNWRKRIPTPCWGRARPIKRAVVTMGPAARGPRTPPSVVASGPKG